MKHNSSFSKIQVCDFSTKQCTPLFIRKRKSNTPCDIGPSYMRTKEGEHGCCYYKPVEIILK